MGLCVLAAGKTLAFAAATFTLSWTHSVEKIRWEEHWRVVPGGLEVVQARVQGSGAGMDPPPDSTFRDGWYVYRPHVPPQRQVHLASSGATVSGWEICAGKRCVSVGTHEAAAITLTPCASAGG